GAELELVVRVVGRVGGHEVEVILPCLPAAVIDDHDDVLNRAARIDAPGVLHAHMEASAGRGRRLLRALARYRPRPRSRNMPCSPSRLARRSERISLARPSLLMMSARSTTMPSSSHSAAKSRMVQRWMFGVLYHFSGRELVTGIRPFVSRCQRTRQCPKLGNDTIARRPIRTSCAITPLGSRVACRVWLRIT